jgi:hypothetical protein
VYIAAPTARLRFYLDVGLHDNVPSGGLPLHEMALDKGNRIGNRHFRDVLLAKGYEVTYRATGGGLDNFRWRATLADAPINLLAH